MRAALKHIVAHTYKPLLVKYLSKSRTYRYENLTLEIPPEVFHPRFFTSTKLLLNVIKKLPLRDKKFLEPGCGSGLIALYAAKHGARVTATDINPVAIRFLSKNAEQNKLRLQLIESDLFRKIPLQRYDIIAINPPYYKKKPLTFTDYAWYCGENGEYFRNLFSALPAYIHSSSEVYMVLCDGCDLDMINAISKKNGFRLNCIQTKQTLIEKNFIYKIEAINDRGSANTR
jgi:release factor glutamine methyltransferase